MGFPRVLLLLLLLTAAASAAGCLTYLDDGEDDIERGEPAPVVDPEAYDPPKVEEPPDVGMWIEPTADNVEVVEYDDGVTRVYPRVPRTPDEIDDEMERRQRMQVEYADEVDAPEGWRMRESRAETGIEFEHTPRELAKHGVGAIIVYFHYGGVATADVDGSGYQDLYFLNADGANELWMNDGDGTFTDVTDAAGVGVPGEVSSSASFADVTGNGYPDLYVTSLTGENVFFENQGDGTFRDVTEEAGVGDDRHSSSAVFFDHDGDGELDLYVVNLADFASPFEGASGYRVPDAYNIQGFPAGWAEASVLYENQGDGSFEPVESAFERPREWDKEALLVPQPGSPPGVYVANMDGEDALYENTGSGFTEVTSEKIGETAYGSFSGTVFDSNSDGLFDLYVTDKHSDMMMYTGHADLGFEEIWTHGEPMDPSPDRATEETRHHGHGEDVVFGSAFHRQVERGLYDETSEASGAQTFLPWGVEAADLNADGAVDLVVTGGMEYARYKPDALLLNDGDGSLRRAEFLAGMHPRDSPYTNWKEIDCDDPPSEGWCQRDGAPDLDGVVELMNTRSSRGAVAVDLDGDGALDVVTNEFNGPPRVLENNVMDVTERGYLKVDLHPSSSADDGIGAVVRLQTDDGEQYRFKHGRGFRVQNDRPLHFGLGEDEKPRKIEVTWPSGQRDSYEITERDRRLKLRER